MFTELPIALIISGASLLLFTILAFVQSFRNQTQAGCLSTLLTSISFFAFVAFVLQFASSEGEITSIARYASIGIASSMLFVGIALWLLDRRNNDSQPRAMYSRGVLSIGTGALLLASFLIVPAISDTIIQIPTSTPIAAAVQQDSSDGSNIVPTSVALNATSTSFVTFTPTQTKTPLPEPSPTRTRRAYVPPTPTATPDAIRVREQCGGRTLTNLNVRAEDTTDAEIVAIIPKDTYIPLNAKNADGDWWQTEFQDEIGWVSEEFLALDSACELEREP